ncbi:MAG: ABC transporter permease subunit [Bifidobacterium pseudocatenulatum]
MNKGFCVFRIATAFPITLQLTFIALIIAVVFSVIFGVLAALYRDTWVDQVIRVISIIAIATPSFWLGVLLITCCRSSWPCCRVRVSSCRSAWIPVISGAHGHARVLAGLPCRRTDDPHHPNLHGRGTG